MTGRAGEARRKGRDMLHHDLGSDLHAMPIALSLNAISFLNQISRAEAQRIERALERLSRNYDAVSRSHVHRLSEAKGPDGHPLLSYRAARDIRVFFHLRDDKIDVVEIIRRSQIESIRALPESAT